MWKKATPFQSLVSVLPSVLTAVVTLISLPASAQPPQNPREARPYSHFDLTETGENALTLAVSRGDLEEARRLLRQWFPINAARKDFITPLGIALQNEDPEMIRLLLNFHARLINTESGTTVWHLLSSGKMAPDLQDEMIHRLSDTKLGIDQADRYTKTPLHYAVSHGTPKRVKDLLTAGANPFLRDRYGETALHKAARKHDPEILELLLDAGVPVDELDHYGNTPLKIANLISDEDIGEPYLRTLEILKQYGADPEHKNQGGNKAGALRELRYASPPVREVPTIQEALPPPPPPRAVTPPCHTPLEIPKTVQFIAQQNHTITEELLKPEPSQVEVREPPSPPFFTLKPTFPKGRSLGRITGRLTDPSIIQSLKEGRIPEGMSLGNTLFLADGYNEFSFDSGINAEKVLEIEKNQPGSVGKIVKTDMNIGLPKKADSIVRRALDLHSAESWNRATEGETYDTIIMKNGICCCCSAEQTCAGIGKENSQALMNQVITHLAPGGHALFWTSVSGAKGDRIYDKWQTISAGLQFPPSVSVQETYDFNTGNFTFILQKQER